MAKRCRTLPKPDAPPSPKTCHIPGLESLNPEPGTYLQGLGDSGAGALKIPRTLGFLAEFEWCKRFEVQVFGVVVFGCQLPEVLVQMICISALTP